MTPQLHVTVDYDAFTALRIASVELAATVQFLLDEGVELPFPYAFLGERLREQLNALDASRKTATPLAYTLAEAADV